MLIENTLFGTVDKEKEAMELLKKYEPPEGYYVCFSGGKDSVVILDLVKRAGVKFEAFHSIITIEPPELMKFIYSEYPEVQHIHAKTTMHKLIVKYGTPPLRTFRYCCWRLKTVHGTGRFKVDGVRAAESPRRAKRQKIEIAKGDSNFLHLIFDWTTDDVWQYIHARNLPYCKLYDEGAKRIGCVFCPFASLAENLANVQRYPQFFKYFVTACNRAIQNRLEQGKETQYKTGLELFKAWLFYDLNQKSRDKSTNQISLFQIDKKERGTVKGMLTDNTLFGTVDKEKEAMELLKKYEPPEGYYVCFSGGKDSVTVLDLVKRAGVKFEAHYHIMTIEPPELIPFIQENYPEVEMTVPEKDLYQLIIENGIPPLRQMRYCHRELKAPFGQGRFKVTGIRAEESKARKARSKFEVDTKGGGHF